MIYHDISFFFSSRKGLIAPVNNVENKIFGNSHSNIDDNGTVMNQQLGGVMDYSTNSINDEYMELSSANINKTFFRSSNNSIITSQVGSIVHLPCRVHLIGDEMVMKSLFNFCAFFLKKRKILMNLLRGENPE